MKTSVMKTSVIGRARLAITSLLCCSLLPVGCGKGGGTPAAPGSRYVITDLNPPYGPQQPAQDSDATALNDVGQVTITADRIGGGISGPNSGQSFLYDNGKYTSLPLINPVAINNKGEAVSFDGTSQNGVMSVYSFADVNDTFGQTSPGGINDQGQIAGTSTAAVLQTFGPNVQQAALSYVFLYQNRQVTRLDLFPQPGGVAAVTPDGAPAAINSAGQVAGAFYTNDASANNQGKTHAFFYNNGLTTDLGTLGGDNSGATALNNRGQAVGYSDVVGSIPTTIRYKPGTPLLDTPPVSSHAALWQNGTVVDMSAPYAGYATAINDQGQTVGFFVPSQYELRAFVYRDGKFHDLNTLLVNSGWTIRTATGINSKGQICGTGIYKGLYHAVLLTPQ